MSMAAALLCSFFLLYSALHQATIASMTPTEAAPTVAQLCTRLTPFPLDEGTIVALLHELRGDVDATAAGAGVRLLKEIADAMPHLFTSEATQLALVKEASRLGRSGSSGPVGA